jgi:glycosyltransferase involved in cell wall biosynthesis
VSDPLVTILINNFNYGRYLGQAIESALSQSYRNFEVVVVDDGSTDESRSIIASYGERIKPVLKPNGGQSSAFNAGFESCHGEIICFLDSDDWFFPNKLMETVRTFKENERAQWVFHPLEMVFPDRPTSIEPRIERTAFIDMRVEALSGKLTLEAPATSGISFSRKMMDVILPMPEQIRLCSDNYLKFAGMSLAPGVYLRDPLAALRIHQSNAFTLRPDRMFTRAQTHLVMAKELRERFPALTKLSNKIFAKALVDYARAGRSDPSCRSIIIEYIRRTPLTQTAGMLPRTLYYFVHGWPAPG